jgi:hypothetical protein
MPMASFSTDQNKIKISKTIGLLTLPLKDRMIIQDDFFPHVDHLSLDHLSGNSWTV